MCENEEREQETNRGESRRRVQQRKAEAIAKHTQASKPKAAENNF